MSAGNGRSSRWRISQAMASMSSLSLGLWSSDGGAGASNRISYSRYGAAALEQATAASIATTIGLRPLMRASIPRGRLARQVCSRRRRFDHGRAHRSSSPLSRTARAAHADRHREARGALRRDPYLGDTLTAEIEVRSLKPDKPVCQLRATITNQDGTVVLEGEVLDVHAAPGVRAPRQRSPSSRSFRTRRRILPEGVFGMASTNS